MIDLRPVIVFHRSRCVEQGCEQILLDIPDIAASFLHAVEDIRNVVAVQCPETRFHQVSRNLTARQRKRIAPGGQHLHDQGNDTVHLVLAVLFPQLKVADIPSDFGSQRLYILPPR